MDPITAIFYAIYTAIEVGGIGFSATAATAMAYATTYAAVAAGSYLLNKALAPSIKTRQERQTWAFGSQTTEEQGGAIPVVTGSTRVHANIVGHYMELSETPYVVRNSAASRHILACFGEGPWAAEPDETTLRLNGRPFSDFPDVTTEWKLGLVDQTAMTAWSAFRQDYWVGQTCITNEPVTYTMTRSGFDDLAVHLHMPKGLIHYGTDGDTHSETLTVKIEVGDAIADSWHTLAQLSFNSRLAQPVWKKFLASSTYTGGSAFNVTPTMRPRARVTLLTGMSDNSRHIRDLEFAAVQVTKNVGFTHPGMVLLDIGTVPNEVLSGGVTEISVETTGKVVQDEAGDFDVSRYHADAIREILTQPVIEGDGDANPWEVNYYRGVDSASLVGAGWAAQKALADTQVPDGLGNNVDMLRFDTVFTGGSAHDAIGQVGASGRCGVLYQGNQFGLWVDTPRTPVGILCDGNWERGSAQLVPIAGEELAGEASVRYTDADSGHAERTILVIDHDMDTLTTVNLDLAGTNRTHEAARLARRELARNRLVDLTLACAADIDAIVYEAGDVVYCQIDGRSLGGRVVAATATTLTIDRSVTDLVTGDDVVIVQRRDSVTGIQELDIQSVVSVSGDGKTITVAGWDTTPDVGNAFLFGPAAIEDDDQFEVTEVSLDIHLHASLSLVRYAPVLDELDAVAPTVYVPLGSLGRTDRYGGVVRKDLTGLTVDQIGTRGDVVCEWGFFTFTANDPGAGSISWATDQDDDGDDSGYVRYGQNLYQPADGNTANIYVYWDPDSPAVFSTTDDFGDVVGKFLVAVNDSGTPITGFGFVPVDATAAIWANISGLGKPEDNATVGATWGVNIANQPDHFMQAFYQDAAPSGVGEDDGDFWIDTNDGNKLYRYVTDTWVAVQDADVAQALSDAASAQSTADGKIVTFAQASEPTAEGVGDIWLDTDDNNKPYRWTGAAWVAVDYDVATWSKIIGTGKPANYADVTADSPIDTFRETFENPNSDFATRWTITGDYSIVAEAGVAGGKILRAGDNSGNDEVYFRYNTKIPYDPDKLYRMRVRVRTTAGSGYTYAGVYAYDNTGAGVSGQPNGGSGHYICMQAEAVASDWTVYTGYFAGHSADGTAGECPRPDAPGALKTGSAYVVPRLLLNHNAQAGITDVDEIVIDIIPEDADQIAEGATNKFAAESGADVTADHATSILFRQDTEPADPQEGWTWWDTSGDPVYIKRYDGAEWVVVGVDIQQWLHGVDPTKLDGSHIYPSSVDTDALAANSVTAAKLMVDMLSAITQYVGKLVGGSITGSEIIGGIIRTATFGRYVQIDEEGIKFFMVATAGLYGTTGNGGSNLEYGTSGSGGSGAIYGSGMLARFYNMASGIPFDIVSEQPTVGDMHLFPRSSDPTTGKPGDVALVNNKLRLCTAATPTWADL